MPPGGNDRFDVRVRSTPATTPDGERFAAALARVFAVDVSIAERIASHTPLSVRRNVDYDVAESVRAALASLGADVEVVEAVGAARSSPPAPPGGPSRTAAAAPSRPPLATRSTAPPRAPSRPPLGTPSTAPPRAPSRPPLGTPSWRPPSLAPPPSPASIAVASVRPPSTPLPSPGSPLVVSRTLVALGAVAVLGSALLVGAARALRTASDAQSLGNTAPADSFCRGHHCLTGPGLDPSMRANRTLVVAWRDGCMTDDYREFLETLAARHPGSLRVIAAALAIPATRDPRGYGQLPAPPPDPWPPPGCAPRIDVLPIERGYVEDVLSPPATYLCDGDGALIAVWRGAMGTQQRERLTAYVENRPYDK